MRLRPEQLAQNLKQQLHSVYLVSGEEPLLLQECCDLIRRQAREAGCTDREVLEVDGKQFDWQQILSSASAMSLFSDRKLIELRLPSGKPGTEGSKALCEYLNICGEDNILLISAGKIDRQSTNSKWFKALDKAGAVIQVWPVDARELPRWLQRRVEGAGLQIDPDALQMLCDRVEGNLLAAVQEVEKLKLLASDGRIDAATVANSVADNARYNLFGMVDAALAGQTDNSLRMLYGLRGEGTEAAVVLWALAREMRTLQEARALVDAGQNPQQVFRSLRVWDKRIPLVQGALQRHDALSMSELLELASSADGSIKGYADGKPWDRLAALIYTLASGKRVAA